MANITLTDSWQTITEASYYSAAWGGTYVVKLQGRYRTSTISGNTTTVQYRLNVNAPFYTTATSSSNSWRLAGTGATESSTSGGTFTLNAGDNIISTTTSSTITGGTTVTVSGGYYMGYNPWGSTSLSGDALLPVFVTAPNTPTISAAMTSDTTIEITYGTTSFGNPSTGTVTLYGGTNSSPTTVIDTYNAVGNKTFTYTMASSDDTYYFRAKATNGQVDSDYSIEVRIGRAGAISFYGSVNSVATSISDFLGSVAGTSMESVSVRSGGTGNISSIDFSIFKQSFISNGGKYSLNGEDLSFIDVYILVRGTNYPIRITANYSGGGTAIITTSESSSTITANWGISLSGTLSTGTDYVDITLGEESQAKRITKTYGSVNGRTKLVCQSFGHLSYN